MKTKDALPSKTKTTKAVQKTSLKSPPEHSGAIIQQADGWMD